MVLGGPSDQSGEAVETFLRHCKTPPIQQHRFGFPAGRVQHEIGSASAKCLCRTVNQNLLVSAGAQIYCLAARVPVFRSCFWHCLSLSTQVVYKIVMTLYILRVVA